MSLGIFDRLRTARETGDAPEGATSGGGGSTDAVDGSIGEGFSLWISAGAETIDYNDNEFEDGYNGRQPVVTVGVDYLVFEWLTAGLAFNYTNFRGDYNRSGHFNSNTYGPLLYASLTPWENLFTDVVLSYSRQNNFRTRDAEFIDEAGTRFGGNVSGQYNSNIYNASTLLGYDYPIDNFTIGPRIGFNYAYYDIDTLKEDGQTGLEVEIRDASRSSLQSVLGATATASFSVPFGVIVPQVSASWIHEYLLDQRNAEGKFVQDNRPNPTRFRFTYYESPDRNYALINLGLSAVLPNDWQPFVNFSTIQANDRLTTYGGVIGLRVGL